ncbi:hypothetical protein Pan44_12160 [Caulifigura coniformis]|uniref:OstA-like protein n=1 Tax=Caulifigura coniformis TaxID=2527983 RepID=A0A517SAP1_9PLAN|nr:hypothetical protein [Caulifigura coniformis]QDT53200.1 hypothetical protein Pan44_12160 [Caulifigura coniformis]
MNRLTLTLLTTLALFCVYRVYAVVLGPMTRTQVMPVAPPVARITGSGHASHSARNAARQFLAQQPWAENAKFTWEQLDQKFIYFNEIGPVEGKGQVENRNQYRFRPFAMIVQNPSRPDDPPTVLAADEARVTFRDKIEQFGTGDSGNNRIIGAELDTGVMLTGPNGLILRGRNFVFSETTRSLYSDEPLQFGFGPTSRSKSRFLCDAEGIAITLEAGNSDILGKDLPRIADFEHLTLRRNVNFQIDYESRGKLTPVRVTSAGSFEFNRETSKASFDNDVKVVQRTSNEDEAPLHNRLTCERLELLFDAPPPAIAPPADNASKAKRNRKQELWDEKVRSIAGMTLHFVVALSRPRSDEEAGRVQFVSEENSLTASMEQATFDAQQGVLFISDPEKSVIERHDPDKGTVTRLLTRRMLIGLELVDDQPAPDSKSGIPPVRRKFGALDWVKCEGLGRMLHIDEATGQSLFDAHWTEKLNLTPDVNSADSRTAPRLLKLEGKAKVVHGLDQWLRADTLTLTLPPEIFQNLDANANDDHRLTSLPVRRAVAKGNVEFGGLEATGVTNSLDVLIVEGKPPVVARQPSSRQPGQKGHRKTPTTTPPWELQRCDRIEAEVVFDPELQEAGLRTATVHGPFEIHRPELVKGATDETNGRVRIGGQKMMISNEGDDRQIVALVGRMHGGKCVERARIHSGAASLEGDQIQFDRARSTMNVTGRTEVTWPVQGDLTGKQLATSMLMTVGCAEGLAFNGQDATFSRNVVVRMEDESRMSCDVLVVGLDRPWSFNSMGSKATRPEVSVIRSPGRVSVNMVEWQKSSLARIVEAELGSFEVHPREGNGQFRGSGPGTMRQWQRGSFHFRVTPEASASANRPAASTELPWNFVQLDFQGQVTGNVRQRFATFEDRVKAIYAPVSQAGTPFKRHELSGNTESAKRAVWVGCDQLNVSLTEQKPEAPNGFITLNAQGRVELESQKVQANAYQISFEEEKDIFELRGRGEEMASIYFDSGPERGRIPGRVIQFNLKTGTPKIVEAGTVTSGSR